MGLEPESILIARHKAKVKRSHDAIINAMLQYHDVGAVATRLAVHPAFVRKVWNTHQEENYK